MLPTWLRRILGLRCCEEWTQWKTCESTVERLATPSETIWNQTTTVRVTRRWQERRCTICGKVQQRELKYW